MGAWGSGLYANDMTCDIRDAYMEYLMDQMSDEDAYEKILKEYAECLEYEDDTPLFWYALAETQWKVGRLLPEVKEKALYWIERNGGLEPWLDTPSKGKGWLRTLDRLREKLNSPMPKRRNVRRPKPVDNNLWEINDIYAYQFHEKKAAELGYAGKYMVIQKIGAGHVPFADGPVMCVQFFDKLFDHFPTLEELEGVRILPVDFPNRSPYDKIPYESPPNDIVPFQMSTYFKVCRKHFYPKKFLTFLGNRQIISNNMDCKSNWVWSHVDWALYETYQRWQGIEYETIGDGIYHYMPKKKNDNA